MAVEISDLDRMQGEYRAAVEQWMAAVRVEEGLASVADHSLADVDAWEGADRREEEARGVAKEAKRKYEGALREKFFQF